MPHQRRKSGGTSTSDMRKSVTVTDMTKHRRPGLSRRQTPVTGQKLGKSQREREREWHEAFDDERESFPQFCMTCEKQFVPYDDKHLYCSENCRRVDQSSSATSSMPRSYGYGNYPFYSAGEPEPRDIIPQASPSRPSSTIYNHSPPTPTTPATTSYHTSALSALRSIHGRPPSPPSPSAGGSNFWPFNNNRSAATSPSTSYSRPSATYLSSTYDVGYNNGGYYTYDYGSNGMDRPLPTRRPSHARPKSIELVTPMVGGR
ncbi:hypothetical protein V2G26_013772 [Clonostachys chloroleuca]|uniref:Life-span regulatory factor domain-containing protein n=1 Tax=Clonostachys chloroleuca TaxID=1926264 RepID=A0AA35M1R9_9HYPO|nr:unnamed protein product [Clonostachys chloroleuca]